MKRITSAFLLLFALFINFTSSAQVDYYLVFQPGDNVVSYNPLPFFDNASAITLEAEVTVDSITDWTHLLSKVLGPTDRVSLQYHQGKLYAIVSNGNNSYKYTSTAALTVGTRYHLAMVYDGGTTQKIWLYINGVSQALTASTGTLPTSTPTNTVPFKVGDGKFKGKIDEVRVWNTALSGYRINNWKDTAITSAHPEFTNLKIYWNFNDPLSPDTAFASQGTAFNGLINGAVYMVDSSSNINPIDTTLPIDTIVGGYLPYYKIKKVTPDIFDHLTHLYYFSLGPNANGDLGRVDNAGVFTPMTSIPTVITDLDTLKAWRGSKTTKIFLVVGGWVQSDYFDEAVANATSRTNLVNTIKTFCLNQNLDGVDLDWEPYNGPVNDVNYGLLIADLRAAFVGTTLQISATINPTHTGLANEFAPCDFIQLMSYGANFGQNTQVPMSTLQNWVNGWINSGYPKGKIVIGLPAFARTPANGSSLTYRSILANHAPNQTQDTVTDNGKLYYYNGVATIKQKAQYALNNNLRGVMVWELGQDTLVTDTNSILRAITTIISVNTGGSTISVEEWNPAAGIVYPNPFTDKLVVKTGNEKGLPLQIELTNLEGKIVLEKRVLSPQSDVELHLSDLPAGVYLVRITAGNTVKVTKVVKQ